MQIVYYLSTNPFFLLITSLNLGTNFIYPTKTSLLTNIYFLMNNFKIQLYNIVIIYSKFKFSCVDISVYIFKVILLIKILLLTIKYLSTELKPSLLGNSFLGKFQIPVDTKEYS